MSFLDPLSNTSKTKPPRRSTFSFRTRASSVSSSASASSASSGSTVGWVLQPHYATEVFWNQYRRCPAQYSTVQYTVHNTVQCTVHSTVCRSPDTDLVTNMIRRTRLRRLVSRDKRYLSAFDLYSGVM